MFGYTVSFVARNLCLGTYKRKQKVCWLAKARQQIRRISNFSSGMTGVIEFSDPY